VQEELAEIRRGRRDTTGRIPFIDVSALGGIGGQEVNFTDKKRNWWVELGSRTTRWLSDWRIRRERKHARDADIRVGQDGALIEYSSSSSSYVRRRRWWYSTEGYVSATNSLGGNEVGSGGRGANCVAGTVGGQNTGGGGGGGGRVRTKPI
jgi:hypothetical protein